MFASLLLCLTLRFFLLCNSLNPLISLPSNSSWSLLGKLIPGLLMSLFTNYCSWFSCTAGFFFSGTNSWKNSDDAKRDRSMTDDNRGEDKIVGYKPFLLPKWYLGTDFELWAWTSENSAWGQGHPELKDLLNQRLTKWNELLFLPDMHSH